METIALILLAISVLFLSSAYFDLKLRVKIFDTETQIILLKTLHLLDKLNSRALRIGRLPSDREISLLDEKEINDLIQRAHNMGDSWDKRKTK